MADHEVVLQHIQAANQVSVNQVADFLADDANKQKLKDSLNQAGIPEDQHQGTIISTLIIGC